MSTSLTSSFPYDSPAIERGVGVFETVLVIGRGAVFLDAHLTRMFGSLAAVDFPQPDGHAVLERVAAVLSGRGVDEGECALRVTWAAHGRDLTSGSSWQLDVSTRAIPPLTLRRRTGSRAITLPRTCQRDTPFMKSTSYLAAVLGLRHAERHGADEGLFVNAEGQYLEGTSTALVAWNGGKLRFAVDGVLPSVTAAEFTQRRRALDAENGPLSREALLSGALVLSALTGAAPLTSLDGESCAVPAEMLAAVDDFNRWMRASARLLI